MYKEDLALKNQQWLICHKKSQNKPKMLEKHTRINTAIYKTKKQKTKQNKMYEIVNTAKSELKQKKKGKKPPKNPI